MQPIVNQSGETDHNYSGLEPLLAERFWINYRLDKRKDGKLLKEPHNGSYSIDPHKPENHLSFLEAKRLMSSGFGIGFVTSMAHDFVAIDLDHCVNEKGILNSLAIDLISQFETYAEFSPSRRGIHLWVRVKNKNSPEMKALLARKRIIDGIEIYGYGQFVTITGNSVPDTPLTVCDATGSLLELYAQYPVQHAVSQEIDWNDQPVTQKSREEVLEIIYNGKNGKAFKILHETGNASLTDLQPNNDGKFDQSKIEAFYFHNVLEAADEDPRMALELFTQSTLFRDKSSDPRGGISYAEYSIGRILGSRLATQLVEQSTLPTTTLPDWPSEPTPLGSYTADKTDTPHLTHDMLPAPLSEYVMDEAKRLNVYPEMIAMPLVATLGITVGSRIAVKPKAKDNWHEYPNLWGYVAGPPGSRKSEAIRAGFRFMQELAKQAQKRYTAREIEYRRQLDIYQEKLKELKKKSKDVDSKQNPQAIPELSNLTEPEKPFERRYSTQDATPEALLELAASNPDGLLITRDELQGIYANFGKQGRENERTLYLEGWDAKSDYRTDRIMRNAAPVERLCLSVFGGTQPNVLQAHISSAYGFGHGADGFIQRFQLSVLNTTNPPYRNEDCTPDSDAYDRVMHLFQKLDEGKFEDFGVQRDEKGNAFLRFTETAQPVFNAWLERNAHKVQALNADGDEPLSNHFAKYNKLVPALALLFHLSSVFTNTPNMIPVAQGISLEALNLALKWANFLEQHARAIYGRVGSNQLSSKHLALKIFELFKSGKVEEGISQRDLRRVLGKSSGEVSEALAELEEPGWVRVLNARKHKGRGTTIIILHLEFARLSGR